MKCEFQQCIKQAGFTKKDSWATVDVFGEDGDVIEFHVVPVMDSDGHMHGLNCHCEPDIYYTDTEGNKMHRPVITHNSFDGREAVQEAKAILNLPI